MCTEDSPSGLWRTLGKRVGCKPSGVRIPHPPPPDPGTASGSGVFVACTPPDLRPPRVLPAREPSAPRASLGASSRSPPVPSGPSGALRTGGAVLLCVAERVVSKPGQAPPPPTGTVARPSGALHTGGTCGAWTSSAMPRRPPAPRPGHAALAAKPRGSVVAGNRPVTALLSPGLVPLKLRGLRRSLRPGVQPGPRPSQRASIGAGPSRCSSIRPSTPSR